MKYEDVVVKENNCFQNDNNITYRRKQRRKKVNKTLLLSVICFVTLFGLRVINTDFTNNLLETFNSISQVGKPTAELFDENSNVFFVSFFNSINLGAKIPQSFKLPVVCEKYECNGTNAVFTPANKVVVSGYDGQVKKIAVENEKKVVYIEHSGGLISRYENFNYVGVITGQIVKQGGTIGSIADGEKLTLSFTLKNNSISFEIKENLIRFIV